MIIQLSRLMELIIKGIMRAMWFSGGFHWIRVKGRLALPSEAPILILAPHTSYFDGIPVTMTMSSIVMKAESKNVPVWGSKFTNQVLYSLSFFWFLCKSDLVLHTFELFRHEILRY